MADLNPKHVTQVFLQCMQELGYDMNEVRAAIVAPEWSAGDKVISDGIHHGATATVTKVFVGFHYKLDKPHDLGPRYGFITDGTAYDTSLWRKLPAATKKGDTHADQ